MNFRKLTSKILLKPSEKAKIDPSQLRALRRSSMVWTVSSQDNDYFPEDPCLNIIKTSRSIHRVRFVHSAIQKIHERK